MEKMLKALGERMDKQEVNVKVKEMGDKVDWDRRENEKE